MPMVRLPKLDLSTFDGDVENWIPFRDSYKNLIHDKKNLASVDEFHYLLAALKEPVKKLLYTISVTEKNYDIAWNLLVSRFDNKRLLIKNHIAALFSMESVKRESSSAILSIVDHFERHVKILNTLGENTEEWSSLLVHLVCSRSDSYTLREWECKTAGEVESPSYVDLVEFLQEQARMLLSLKGGSTVDKPRYSSSHSAVSASYSSKKTCVVCNLQHKIYDSEAFKVLTLEQKHDVVRKNKLCWNCLATSHMSRECQSKNCRKCGDSHHTYLTPSSRADLSTPSQTKTPFFPPKSKNAPSENNSPTNAPEKTRYPITSPNLHLSPTPPDSTPSTSTAMVAAHSTGQKSTVLLSTAVVLVYGPIGPMKVRALLDSGSELNFITERVVQLLKLSKQRAQMHISGMGGASVTSRYATVATICSSDHSYRCDLSFQILPKITGNLPSTVVDTSQLQIPPELNLADPSFALPHRIDMVIGAQLFFSLLCDGQRYISNHSEGLRPILQNTVLGWVVSGPVPIASNSSHSASVALTCTTDDLDFQLSRFWEIEHCPEARSFSKEELACEKLFTDTTTRDELGRFVVRLPTKPEMLCQLGDSATTASKRYHWMQRRLLRDPNLQDQYSQIMLTYGTACAPYLSTRCLKQLAYDHMMINKHVASKISTDFYMDDLISGDQTDDAAIDLLSEVQGILGSAGFELRKWASNSSAVLASIPEALNDDRLFLELDSSPSIKTLGLIWHPKSDSFHFKSPDLIQSQQLTKRIVVSEMAQLFDPLGILGPVVVKAKIFVQQLWRANLSWDDPLSPNLSGAWESYRSDLSTVHLFSVPRRAGEIQLHGFCDASQHAYGACIYVRSSTEDGNIITHLLTAKSRVAPIQQSTIPRLELCSAVLLGHLYTNPPSKFNIYVANRVAKVQRLTVGGSWNHVAGFESPADIISRGATPQELSGNTLWWEGPPWLKLESTNWPRRFTVMESSHVKPEDLEEKSRPLTACSENPDDQQILTPGHFLIGDALKAIPEPDLGDVPTNRLSLWQAMQHKVQRFWKLWSTDYLNQLQQRSKNYFQKPNVVVGKLVLLKEDNLPPLKWSVGRITAVHSGADNLVQVVDVKVPSGAVFDRPISKICLLPSNDAEDGPSSNNE
ncbi:uncharacterized protein LOC129742029 [Uranotaenia lowii]|uniref:uncharacterized protein LOC129742029 n=1 Tax=Uranotaenia lowii TaxID=190385 RepID=UPI0024799C34|nr:uncharacterized protein LOC129742029 [Uranotaenia lowii]